MPQAALPAIFAGIGAATALGGTIYSATRGKPKIPDPGIGLNSIGGTNLASLPPPEQLNLPDLNVQQPYLDYNQGGANFAGQLNVPMNNDFLNYMSTFRS